MNRRRFLTATSLLVTPAILRASPPFTMGDPVFVNQQSIGFVPDYGPFLFNSGGTPSGWSYTGTAPEWNYATSPLEGAGSLYMGDITSLARLTVTDADEYYFAFEIKVSASPSALFSLYTAFGNNGVTPVGYVYLNTDSKLSVEAYGGSLSGKTTGTVGSGGGTFIHARARKSTASNAIMSATITNDIGSGWGSDTVTVSNGTTTDQPDLLVLRNHVDGNVNIWFDRVVAHTSPIPASYMAAL